MPELGARACGVWSGHEAIEGFPLKGAPALGIGNVLFMFDVYLLYMRSIEGPVKLSKNHLSKLQVNGESHIRAQGRTEQAYERYRHRKFLNEPRKRLLILLQFAYELLLKHLPSVLPGLPSARRRGGEGS